MMKQFYKDTINKLFLNKEYFSSIINRHEILLEKKRKKERATLKLALIAVLTFSAIALVSGALLGAMVIACLSIGYSFVAFVTFLTLGFALESINPFEKKNLRDLEEKFASDIADNPNLLKDIYQLCVDKEATYKFNHFLDNIMHGKKSLAALEIFYRIMDNYELHQEVFKSNPVRDLFLAQLKIKEPEPTKVNHTDLKDGASRIFLATTS